MPLARPFFLASLAFLFTSGIALAQDPGKKKDGPERWENDIRKFETAAEASPPPENALLFLGSSSIRMWKLENNFPKARTINRGFGGSTIADSIHYFDRLVVPLQPKAILFYAGDNDVARGMNAEEVAADFQTFAGLVKEKLPGTPLIYIAIKPSVARWDMWPTMKDANDRIAAWCAENEGFYFADIGAAMLADAEAGQPPSDSLFLKDGLHMTQDGYDRWAKVLKGILKDALPKTKK